MIGKVLILSLAVGLVYTWPNGAPLDACDTLTPGHNFTGQTGTPPYTLNLNRINVTAGQEVRLTVTGATSDDRIKGFLAQVFAEEGRVGTFRIEAGDQFVQGLACGNTTNSAATHRFSMDGVASLTLAWIAPSNVQGPANVTITLVKNAATFWVAVNAGTINIA